MQKQHLEFHALAISASRLVVQYHLLICISNIFFFSFHGKRVKIVKEICSMESTREFNTKPFRDHEDKKHFALLVTVIKIRSPRSRNN